MMLIAIFRTKPCVSCCGLSIAILHWATGKMFVSADVSLFRESLNILENSPGVILRSAKVVSFYGRTANSQVGSIDCTGCLLWDEGRSAERAEIRAESGSCPAATQHRVIRGGVVHDGIGGGPPLSEQHPSGRSRRRQRTAAAAGTAGRQLCRALRTVDRADRAVHWPLSSDKVRFPHQSPDHRASRRRNQPSFFGGGGEGNWRIQKVSFGRCGRYTPRNVSTGGHRVDFWVGPAW